LSNCAAAADKSFAGRDEPAAGASHREAPAAGSGVCFTIAIVLPRQCRSFYSFCRENGSAITK
jgi:hypothetical protein